MISAIPFVLLSAVLLAVGAVLRERDVSARGAVGRRRAAHLVTAALVVTVVITAILTLERFVALSR